MIQPVLIAMLLLTPPPPAAAPAVRADPDRLGIERLPEDAPASWGRNGFTKYTEVMAPNGRPIRIIAQGGVRDIAVARARNLLTFFLTDVPDSRFGSDKSAIANAMADNGAMLMMPEGAHEEGREPDLPAQPLYEDETPVDGSRWYLENDWEHRDAAFEEIFHLVHDSGIGTFMPGASPRYQRELKKEAIAAIEDGRWAIPVDPEVRSWIRELAAEDSLAQEYIASVLDTYYGLWSAFDERPGGMWGIYIAKTREELDRTDPRGRSLLEDFLPPMMIGYEALLDPELEGEFTLTHDPTRPWTAKSRWYVDAKLTGTKSSRLIGNASNNTLTGNRGDNHIDGGPGTDTAVFIGPRADYEITATDQGVIVADSVQNRDGSDTLVSIERIRFSDKAISMESKASDQRIGDPRTP